MEWLIDIIKEWVLSKAYATEAWVLAKVYATEAWVLGKLYLSKAEFPDYGMPVNVTGDLSPDATCTYFRAGDYNDKPYYRRLDGAYFIWWEANSFNNWWIGYALGYVGKGWFRHDPDMVGDYAPVFYSGTATVLEGYKYLKTGFVNRGDPAANDWAIGDLTVDGAWHDLDLSGIVPAGAKGVCFQLLLRATAVNKEFYLRSKSNANIINVSRVRTQVAGVWIGDDLTCPCDVTRFVQYWVSPTFVDGILLTVKGWWF